MATYNKLGELLVAVGTITEEELNRGLELQKVTKERLGATLIHNNIITEDELIEALQMQLGIDFIDLTKFNIPTELAQVLPKNIAKQYSVVPVSIVKDELYLAMVDPMNFYAIEEVRKAVRKKVVPMVATAAAVDHAIMVLYGNEGAARAIEEMKREAANKQGGENLDSAFITNQLGDDSADSAPTIRLVNSIIERAINERASDIHIEPREEELHVRMRIDGVMRSVLTVPKNLQESVISRVKIMASLNVSERRIPQDGRFNVRVKDHDIDLRISTLPTVYGEKVVARLLDKSNGILDKETIGLTGENLDKFEKLTHCRNGVVLIVGPTGSGKSTTMYTMVNELNTEDINLVTLEDPVEYNITGVNQVQINEKTNMTFANGLRAILRQDPDIIAVGEIRDGETAEIAMRAAITGHVVLSTIHTNDALGTVERLRNIGVEPYLISSALKGVISQRLVRRICPHCKTAYKPMKEELADLNLDPNGDYTFYKGAGCPNCYETGYRGRIAVFEIMEMTQKIRDGIAKNEGRDFIERELKKPGSGYISLKENAMKLVRDGITTTSEILRVTNVED